MNTTLQVCNWFWWKHRIAISMMLGLVICAQSIYWLKYSSLTWDMLGLLNTLPIMFTMFAALSVFTFGSNLDLTSGKSAFPGWLFTLPIASYHLALVPVVAMALVLAVGWLPTALTIEHYGNFHYPDAPDGQKASLIKTGILPWLIMCAAGNWLQAVAWWPFRNAWYRLFSIGALVFTPALWLSIGFAYELPSSYFYTGIVLAAVIGFLAAVVSAIKARHLTWRSEVDRGERYGGSADALTLADGRNATAATLKSVSGKEFASAMSALRWRDWKSLGRFPPFLMLILAAPLALLVCSVSASIWYMIILLVPAILLAPLGAKLGLNSYWKSQPEMSPYLAGIPVTDERFLWSRILNCLKSAIVMWALGAIVLALWCARSANRAQLSEFASLLRQSTEAWSGWSAVTALILFSLYLAVVAPWIGLAFGLSGRKWVKRTATGLWFFAFIIVFVAITNHKDTMFGADGAGFRMKSEFGFSLLDQMLAAFRFMFLAKLILAGIAILVVRKRNLLSLKSIAKQSATLLIVCAIVIGLFCFLLSGSKIPIRDIALVTATLFPFASLFFSIAALDWNRHR